MTQIQLVFGVFSKEDVFSYSVKTKPLIFGLNKQESRYREFFQLSPKTLNRLDLLQDY